MQHATALLELLLPTLLAATSPTRAPEPGMRPSAVVHSIEIEIVEKPSSGKRTRTRLELPANAKLQARVLGEGTSGQLCTVESEHQPDRGTLRIELDCRVPGRPDTLSLEARPTMALGKRVSLAKIDRPDGGTTEISATLH